MAVLSYLCVALMGYYLWRWLRRSPDKNPLDERFPATPLLVLGVAAALFYWPTLRTDMAAARAGRVASGVVGEKVEYTCGSVLNIFFDRETDMALGYVRWGEDGPEKRSKLRHEICSWLLEYLADPNDLRGEKRQHKVFAVHALSHEARHMAGEMNESRADCQALQRNLLFARAFGATEDAARELAVAYWQEFYPHMPPGYNSTDCRPGGPLDEKLPSSPWNLK
jgi:hypothetical protein